MRATLDAVSKGRDGAALPPTTVSFATGDATLARAETEQRPTVLGLIASGRMRPDSGTVTFNGRTNYSAMRKHIALIDAPDVCEPASDVTVAGLVAEELMFAGRRSDPIAVSRSINQYGVREWSRTAISNVDPATRVRLLAELAVLRKGIEGVVITSPDRHGGDPLEWWRIAREFAQRGFAVLVVAGDASAAALGASALIERWKETNPMTEPILVSDVAAEVTEHPKHLEAAVPDSETVVPDSEAGHE